MASVIALQGNQSFGNHPLVSRFLKGTFTTRPALPKYKEVWDVNMVLEHLKTLHPAETLPLKLLSFKIVMLVGHIVRPTLSDHSCFNYKERESL